MKRIVKKLQSMFAGKYGSYKPQEYDQIAFDETLVDETANGVKHSERGATISSLLENTVARANAFVESLPDNNPTQK